MVWAYAGGVRVKWQCSEVHSSPVKFTGEYANLENCFQTCTLPLGIFSDPPDIAFSCFPHLLGC